MTLFFYFAGQALVYFALGLSLASLAADFRRLFRVPVSGGRE